MDENMMMLGHFRQISFISGGAEIMENYAFFLQQKMLKLIEFISTEMQFVPG